MSMKPGVTAQPDASSTRSPERPAPMPTITPSEIARSATRPGAPVPSTTVPPRMTISALICGSLSRIDHELEQVPVRVADVHTRRVPPATTLARDRTLFHGRAGFVEAG